MDHKLNPADQTLQLNYPGDVLSTNADKIRAEVLALLETGPVKSAGWTTLVLNLTTAKMIDSVGLNLIVGLYKEAKKRGAKTSALIRSPNVQRTFAFTRLDAHIQVTLVP